MYLSEAVFRIFLIYLVPVIAKTMLASHKAVCLEYHDIKLYSYSFNHFCYAFRENFSGTVNQWIIYDEYVAYEKLKVTLRQE